MGIQSGQPNSLSKLLDFAVVPGFSKIGFLVRKKLGAWTDVSDLDLSGKTIVITGPTSGLGAEVARTLSPTGTRLILVGRNRQKLDSVLAEIEPLCPGARPEIVVADMGDVVAVRRACAEIRSASSHIDALIHNAGALLNTREVSAQGIEQTLASHVVGPFLMNSLLLDELRGGRVVTVSSGGMYTQGIPDIAHGASLEMPADSYNGARQYAIAKRVQVTLNEMWAERVPATEFVAMHPGWADTPGVRESIPGFRRVTAPILRSPREGADTISWLAAIDTVPGESGTFWCDREMWPIHKTSSTKKTDTPEARRLLWEMMEQYCR